MDEGVPEGSQSMEFDLTMDLGVAVGSDAKWNLTPRLPNTIDLNDQTFKTVVSNFLKKKGIARPIVRIVQAFRIDLEGDGTEEVLLSATYFKRGPFSIGGQVGDYSVVLLQKTVGKTVAQYLLQGEFVAKTTDSRLMFHNLISAIADLNGDAKMEIVLQRSFAYGDSADVFEMKAGKPITIKEFELK